MDTKIKTDLSIDLKSLHITKDLTEIEILENKLKTYFTETWDETVESLQERIVITDKNLHYVSIFREEDDFLHYDWAFLDEEYRGKGFQTKAIPYIFKNMLPEELIKDCRATVRFSNFKSYYSLKSAGFKEFNTHIIGSDLGIEMIYTTSQKININKYISSKPSSCGLTVLSAVHDLKFHNYIKPDDLIVSCKPNKGIPQQEMLNYCLINFGFNLVKVYSNMYNLSSEEVLHKLEQHFTKYNSYAIVDTIIDGYEHWVLITNKEDNIYYTLDSENKLDCITSQLLYSRMVQTGYFMILL